MYVNVSPKWIQVVGFLLILLFGGGSLNGILAKLKIIETNHVSPIYQGDFTLPICFFFLGLGLGMYFVPRIVYIHSRKQHLNKNLDN